MAVLSDITVRMTQSTMIKMIKDYRVVYMVVYNCLSSL